MRFEVSRVLDAIERRLSIDPVVASAVVDLAEVMRFDDLDGGRSANLLRLGLIVDALGQRLGDSAAAVYAVADRALISDTELTSNERMVIRRWSDDGLIEVIPAGAPVQTRIREISTLTGLALVTRVGGTVSAYAPVPAPGGVALAPHAGQATGAAPARRTEPVLTRLWRCPEPDCGSFGPGRAVGQPPPTLLGGVPTCPRHGTRLGDAGPRPLIWPLAARIDGLVRERFVVTSLRPLVVGRAPEDGVALGPYLDEAGVRWISRSHVRLELRADEMVVTDSSTNGTTVLARSGPGSAPKTVKLGNGQSRSVGEWDSILLNTNVEIVRADRLPDRAPLASPESVMADAPTMAMRLPMA